MPNYVKNVIQFAQSIPQDRINALYKTILNTHPVTGESDWFDFNTLVPMASGAVLAKDIFWC